MQGQEPFVPGIFRRLVFELSPFIKKMGPSALPATRITRVTLRLGWPDGRTELLHASLLPELTTADALCFTRAFVGLGYPAADYTLEARLLTDDPLWDDMHWTAPLMGLRFPEILWSDRDGVHSGCTSIPFEPGDPRGPR